MDPYQKITYILSGNNVQYKEYNHKPIFTLEESSKINGLNINSGAKSLLLRSKNDYYLIVLPGSKRLDSKKLKQKIGTKDLRFASPAEVYEVLGCIVGACYPFGSFANLRTIIDTAYLDITDITFNPGIHTKTISMPLLDYLRIENPEQYSVSV